MFKASLDVIGKVPAGAGMRYRVVETETEPDGKRRIVSEGALVNVSVSDIGDKIKGSVVLDGRGYKLWWPNRWGNKISMMWR